MAGAWPAAAPYQHRHTLEHMKRSYDSLSTFIEPTDRPAFRFHDEKKPISHRTLRGFVDNFTLPIPYAERGPSVRKPVVCIALSNGPILAAVCLAVANRYIAGPVSPAVGAAQFEADVLQSGASCIVTTRADADRLGLEHKFSSSWVGMRKMAVFLVNDRDGQRKALVPERRATAAKQTDDIAIVLFTSGTSGTKKLVPITVQNIVSGVSFVMESWGLTERDVCLNMMPLHHIGGLDIVEQLDLTWYYASPTMHQMILDAADIRQEALAKSRIRLVCNAAGGWLILLAQRLRGTFGCAVLPSYGACPSQLHPSRISWIDLARQALRWDPTWQYWTRKEHCWFLGRWEEFVTAFTSDGWFDTGDIGYLSDDGWLFITGRTKEVINRGGEIISPFEIESAIVSAAKDPNSSISSRVDQALAFSVRHAVLQEVVGVVLFTPPGARRVDLRQLHQALRLSLQQAK
ncbi:hypothetical protein B0H63DRAFT_515447 [Podospora didyma]|uniref:AMP-dependent synthetase/ligase domain-containing protein n=1 Tax=Podospora didyma TaxID=330526 RepID=A0AAE0K093_9PEZI|nr:hypothetical protein B0H63DRAFT_515447 [Podospora didyma]